MLRSLRVQNFKVWEDTGEIRLAPITVFFGSNSSGKTSLLQALLALKQTTESPDRNRVLHFGDRSTLVDLGTYHDLVFQHDEERAIGIELSWDLPRHLKVNDPIEGRTWEGSRMSFTTEVHGTGMPRVARLQYRLLEDAEERLRVELTRREGSNAKDEYELTSAPYHLVRNQGRAWPLPPPVRFYGFPDEAIAYFKNSGFVQDFALALESLFRSLYHVGPLRHYPQRAYLWSGEKPEHVGRTGERTIEALLAAKGRQVQRRPRAKNVEFHELIARWLKEMELIDTFKVNPLGRHRKEHEVLVRTMHGSSDVNLTDVGFGVSQVLPVVVQCFYTPPNSVMIFEQPEIHLHPIVQAGLADLFIEAIQARERTEDRRVQFLIESHSEHFLRRLQRRIAEEKLDRDNAALYFCEAAPSGARIKPLQLDLFGRIDNWPDGFFGDITQELEEQMRSMIERRRKMDVLK